MGPSDFPQASKITLPRLFRVGQGVFVRCPAKEAQIRSDAIRARIDLSNGEAKIAWFVPFEGIPDGDVG
jgi:hypothetical protein